MINLSFTESELAMLQDYFQNELLKHQAIIADLQGILKKVTNTSTSKGNEILGKSKRGRKSKKAKV